MRRFLIFASLLAFAFSQTCPTADSCPEDQTQCQRPDCVCSGAEPNIALKDRPQIVYLTFDDAITSFSDADFFDELFGPNSKFTNPDNTTIRATHFLTHKYTDYTLVSKWHGMGHEIAVHSISHRSNQTYWKHLDVEGWVDEMVGMRTMIHKFADVPTSDVKGIRAAYLQGGGDAQFTMMAENDFQWDCSMPSRAYGYLNLENGWWPFSLDYWSDMDCQIEPCPECSYPNVWVQPMLDLEDEWIGADSQHPNNGMPCAMLDSCVVVPENLTAAASFHLMKKNFDAAYFGNTRAPIGFYTHAAWFFGQEYHFEGYKMLLDYITQFEDVWVVPISAGIAYMKSPVTNAELIKGTIPEFNGPDQITPPCSVVSNCLFENVSNEDFTANEMYVNICGSRCPKCYPWLGDPEGHC